MSLVEAFESFVALVMEHEGLVVSPAVKFDVTRQTAKVSHMEMQTHGFEVDLVGARADLLVLATVKSYLGSRGVVADHVTRETSDERGRKQYALLNDPVVRDAVVEGVASRYGYPIKQIELRLYVGRFAGTKAGEHERRIRDWCAGTSVGRGPIKVVGLSEVAATAREIASRKQYRDNPALVAIKVLEAAGMLIPAADGR